MREGVHAVRHHVVEERDNTGLSQVLRPRGPRVAADRGVVLAVLVLPVLADAEASLAGRRHPGHLLVRVDRVRHLVREDEEAVGFVRHHDGVARGYGGGAGERLWLDYHDVLDELAHSERHLPEGL